MTKEMLLSLLGIFVVMSFTNILATLKTIFISKKIMNPVYLVVFIDAAIFAGVLSKVVSSSGIFFTLAFALGKTFGVFLGGKIEERLALGIIEVDLFISNKEKMIIVAEELRKEGYTVNNFQARGMDGSRRHKIEIVLERKEFQHINDILAEFDIDSPTLKIKNISKVEGKITTKCIKPSKRSKKKLIAN
jgi:uncharacterized protein YebE (UPF0316 family)